MPCCSRICLTKAKKVLLSPSVLITGAIGTDGAGPMGTLGASGITGSISASADEDPDEDIGELLADGPT